MSMFEQMNIRIAEIKRKRAERRRKREADELVSDSESSSNEEEELEDHPSSSNCSEEDEPRERKDTPPQSDLIEDPESPPAFRFKKPATRSASKVPTRPTMKPKLKASKKKTAGPSSSSRKRPRGSW